MMAPEEWSSLVWWPLVPFLLMGLFLFAKTIYSAYLTPLAPIPGFWLAKFTSLPLKFHTVRGRRMLYVHNLHQIYGPVVRIAPNQVDVSDVTGYNAIHKISNGFGKSQWYPRFRTAFASQDVFSETNTRTHATRRKLMSRPFSKSNLKQNWAGLVMDKAELAVSKIQAQAKTGRCDVFEWWSYYSLDVIGRVSLGESFGLLELGKKTAYVEMFEHAALIGTLRSEFPILYKLADMVPNFIFDINADEKRVIFHGKQIIGRAEQGSVDRTNVFTGFLTDNNDKSIITEDSMVTEATGLIGAGGGTTSVTLTYLVWAVLSQPLVQEKLEHEVAQLSTGFTDADLEELPYMNAVIEETLRAYCPISGGLSRVAPKAGAHISGYYLPPGTVVSTQSYSMHRDSHIFPDAERFDPGRFLRPNREMKDKISAYAAFGAGARTCLGVHLARMELRAAVAFFFRECAGAHLKLSSPDDMDMVNFFGIVPKGRRCHITLAQP